MSLPSGAIWLEYIESTGAQHIDTELITQSEKLRVECEFRYTAAHASTALFGNQKGTSSPYAFSFTLYGAGPDIYVGASAPAASIATEVGKTHRLVLEADNGALTITLDGTITRGTYSGSLNHTLSTALFGNNINGAVSQKCSARIKKWRAYDNGILVRDFIPCKLSDGSVGLWEEVEGKFYGNAGTGTFVAGPAAEIVELEWIESSGTQHTDTGFKPNNNTRVEMTATALNVSATTVLFGSRNAAGSAMFYMLAGSGTLKAYYNTSSSLSFAATAGEKIDISLNKGAVKVNGESGSYTNSAFQCNYPLLFFALRTADTIHYNSSIRLYACQIYDNGLLVRDYIPAKTIEGEVGLYDQVLKEFYRNAGTGEFVAGPEMMHEDYTELEYIESSGSQYADTGFVPDSNTRVVAEMEVTAAATSFLFGSRTNSSANSTSASFSMVQISGTSLRSDFGSAENAVALSPLQKLAIDKNKASTTVNGVATTATAQTFSGAYSLVLFSVNTAGAIFATKTAAKLYVFQVYDNGTEVRAYIPMLHPSGVPGLWDSVNKRFYASATTADFIAGPEKVKAPKAPGNFRVVSESDTEVALAWDASENAAGYRLYRDGAQLADTMELAYTDPAEPFGAYTYTVRAYNEFGEGEAAELVVILSPDNPLLWLVTDRTAQDVSERNSKGVYSAQDLNRVGAAVEYLRKRLLTAGILADVFPQTDWTAASWMTPATAEIYLANIRAMRAALTLPKDTPKVPDDLKKFTHTEANNIEIILLALDRLLTNVQQTVDAGWATGTAYTGFYAKEAN